jgi:hypothetical protein
MIRVDFGPISETVYIDIILNTIIEGERGGFKVGKGKELKGEKGKG